MHGPRVVGEQEFAKKQAVVAARRHHFGPRVADALPDELPNADTATTSLSIEGIENILRENGTHFDTLLDAELSRVGGPRAEALHLFRALEMEGIAGGPRTDTIADIDALLGTPETTGTGESSDDEVESDEEEGEEEGEEEDANGDPVLRVKDDSAPTTSGRKRGSGRK